jgi:hypothetical protein
VTPYLFSRIFTGPSLAPATSASSRLRTRDDGPAFRGPTGSSKQQSRGSKANLPSGRDERLEAHDVHGRNKICANWNVLCWIGNGSAHNKCHACQHCHFWMKHIQMVAITRMHAERNEWRRSEKTSNFFWVHTSNLREPLRFLNANHAGGGPPKWAACEA